MTDEATSASGASGGRESAVTGVDRRDGAVVLSLAGELDLYNAEEVRAALLEACAGEPKVLVVDLQETRRALEVSGLDRHFLVHDTVAEALEATP